MCGEGDSQWIHNRIHNRTHNLTVGLTGGLTKNELPDTLEINAFTEFRVEQNMVCCPVTDRGHGATTACEK